MTDNIICIWRIKVGKKLAMWPYMGIKIVHKDKKLLKNILSLVE